MSFCPLASNSPRPTCSYTLSLHDALPIFDILEFLLRISTQGNVLYPTTDQHTEEIPGLLKELKMGVTGFTVCAERSLTQEEVDAALREGGEGKKDVGDYHDTSHGTWLRIA